MATPERILDSSQRQQVEALRTTLSELSALLESIPANPADIQAVTTAGAHLDDFFLLVVVGEFNSGKSALVNALLGKRVLAEGVTPTTSRVQILKHSQQVEPSDEDASIAVVSGEADFLWDIHLVDTPGTNAIAREHEAVTKHFVPRADLVLFVTSADRPFTESERAFLQDIRDWGKKILFVVNKIDILHDDTERETVLTFVRDSARGLLEVTPEIFATAARPALEARQAADSTALEACGLPRLETFIRETLTDAERFRLKLLSPVGVGLRLAGQYAQVIADRLELLKEDAATVAQIRSGLAGYREEMKRGFTSRMAEVDNVLHRFEQRGNDFFDETLRIGRVFDLMNKSKIQADFERDAVAEMPREVETKVEEIIDWLVASDLRQWQDVRDRLLARRSEHSERVAGTLNGGFEYDRARLLETVGREAQRTLTEHDEQSEARRMAESVQAAVTNAALIEVGAVGLGTAVALIASSTAADVTGVMAAGLLATVGFFVIPYRKNRARKELRERIARLRKQLMDALEKQFQKEVDRSVGGVEEAIGPYVRFVEGEKKLLGDRGNSLARVREQLARISERAGKA